MTTGRVVKPAIPPVTYVDVCPCGRSYSFVNDPDPAIYAHWWAEHGPHYQEANLP